MNNIIAFPEPKPRRTVTRQRTSGGPVTLFVHVRRATLIAHLTGRGHAAIQEDGRVGKK